MMLLGGDSSVSSKAPGRKTQRWGARTTGQMTPMIAVMLLLGRGVDAARAVDGLDAQSWSSLASSAAELRSKELTFKGSTTRSTGFVRPPCANVDIPCSETSPVYKLDTETRQPDGSGRLCWSLMANWGHAPPRYPPPLYI